MVLALLALGAYFSYATLAEQSVEGADAGRAVAEDVTRQAGPGARVLTLLLKSPRRHRTPMTWPPRPAAI